EDAFGAWVVDVPGKLLGDDVDLEGVLPLRRQVRPAVPRRDGEAGQEDDLDDGDAELAVGGDVRSRAEVVGAGVALGVEAVEGDEEVRAPDHEEDGHEPVREHDQVVDLRAVRGGVDGHPLIEKLSHRKRPPLITRRESRRARRARARRQKPTNIAPRPTCTKPITPRRKKMPLFVPLTMAELGSPKQTGQAEGIWGMKGS